MTSGPIPLVACAQKDDSPFNYFITAFRQAVAVAWTRMFGSMPILWSLGPSPCAYPSPVNLARSPPGRGRSITIRSPPKTLHPLAILAVDWDTPKALDGIENTVRQESRQPE